MDLADLFEDTAEVRATYKHLTFAMRVYTEKLTPEYRAKAVMLAARAQAEASAEGAAEAKDETALMIADLVDSWKDETGQPITVHGEVFEPTYENMVKLSYPLLSTLLREITKFLGEQANPPSATA